ncbi:hypothetical protein [Streptomyces sp. SCSIO ZS0520]|uniref:hypothetical protein n=1 Tax=Streptomyces sp. SCSIO ZS0520 TaxID=2892996 RepID=UPI0021DAF69C|nr:hypothetical protein [Streptomyces sp. SCSIO ZS0520]
MPTDPSAGPPPGQRPEPLTPLDFQLVLLRRMADHQPELVEEARRELGASATRMREANRRWQAMLRSPGGGRGAGPHRSVLGPPERELTRRVGELECTALLWPVPLWPSLRFEVLLAPGGARWNEWLIRAPGAGPAAPRGTADLRPWTYTVEEVAGAFAPARPLEGTAPTRWGLAFEAPDEQGRRRACVAEFTWGLLQRFRTRDEGTEAPAGP